MAPNEKAIKRVRDDMNRLRGRLFGAVETTGMPTQQQNALKGLIRQMTYDAQANLEETLRKNGTG